MTGKILSIGIWNKVTIEKLSDETGEPINKLWDIIEAQHKIEVGL